MRKIPVSGARSEEVKTPHMPAATKFASESSRPVKSLTSRASRNPVKAPVNMVGAKMPPSPPHSSVKTVPTTLSRTAARLSSRRLQP